MKRLGFLLLSMVLTACGAGAPASAAAPAASNTENRCTAQGRISGEHAKKLSASGAVLLDVRSPEKYWAEHLPDAKNIPYR